MIEATTKKENHIGLTKRQREIADYIKDFIEKQRYSPSYREIMKHFGLNSTSSIHKHIVALQKKGYINFEKNAPRSLHYHAEDNVQRSEETIELPFMGQIAEGQAIETFAIFKSFSVSKALVRNPSNSYILKVRDDSFNEELLMEGDLLIIEARTEASPGDVIIASVNDHESFIKRYYPEGQYIKLECNSKIQHPIIISSESLHIQGCLVALLRTYN